MSCPQVQKRTNLGLCLSASDELALIGPTDYMEDFYGVDGQLTLHHVLTSAEFSISMSEASDFDDTPHNFFDGSRAAAPMPLGKYEVRGKVMDTLGNEVVLTQVQTMDGTEDVQSFCFELVDHHVGPHTFTVPGRRRIHPVPSRFGNDPRWFELRRRRFIFVPPKLES